MALSKPPERSSQVVDVNSTTDDGGGRIGASLRRVSWEIFRSALEPELVDSSAIYRLLRQYLKAH